MSSSSPGRGSSRASIRHQLGHGKAIDRSGSFSVKAASAMCVIVGVFVFGLWSALLLKAQKPVPDSHEWKVYTNAKFSYAICYPNDLLIPQGEPDAGDGQTFLAKDGAKLTVFSDYGSGDIALKDRLEWTTSELAGAAGKVTYKVIRPQMFVVSGRTGQTVFYAKADTTLGKFKEFELTYDLAQSAVYDPIVKRLAGGCFVNIGGK